jgi:hypothetical protein
LELREVLMFLVATVVCGGMYIQYTSTVAAPQGAVADDGSLAEVAALQKAMRQKTEQVATLTAEVTNQEKREQELMRALGTLEANVASATRGLRAGKAPAAVLPALAGASASAVQQNKVLPPAAGEAAAASAADQKGCVFQDGVDFTVCFSFSVAHAIFLPC